MKIDEEVTFEGNQNWLCRQDQDWLLIYTEAYTVKKLLGKVTDSLLFGVGSIPNGEGKRKAIWYVRVPVIREKTVIRLLSNNG